MTADSLRATLDWRFVSVMMSQSVYVIAVANTIGSLSDSGRLGPIKVGRAGAAFIASLMLTVYSAYKGGWSWHPASLLEVLAYAVILFCLSAGAHQSVLAVARRVGAGRGMGMAQRAEEVAGAAQGAREERRWWASWF